MNKGETEKGASAWRDAWNQWQLSLCSLVSWITLYPSLFILPLFSLSLPAKTKHWEPLPGLLCLCPQRYVYDSLSFEQLSLRSSVPPSRPHPELICSHPGGSSRYSLKQQTTLASCWKLWSQMFPLQLALDPWAEPQSHGCLFCGRSCSMLCGVGQGPLEQK